jgi:hypothetical protein
LKIKDILGGKFKRKIRRGSRIKRMRQEDLHLNEGGNVFDGTTDFEHSMIPGIMKSVNTVLSKIGIKAIPIGSGATPTKGKVSGDLDMIVDVDQLKQYFKMEDAKDADIRKKLRQLYDLAGFETAQTGSSVHVKVPMGDHAHQVDIMVVPNAANAAQFHTHNIPAGSKFKGTNKHQLLSVIARQKGMLWSNFVGLFKRLPNGKKDPNGFITSDINEIAKLLLGPNARKEDMGSVESIVAALGKEGEELLANIRANDPNWKELD